VNAAAALVVDYFIPMAERVYGDASIPAAERAAMVLARRLQQESLVEFNARDMRRQIGGVLRDAWAMDAACAALVEAGLIRPLVRHHGRGRKPKSYAVSPLMRKQS
jgi:hypothetical protein